MLLRRLIYSKNYRENTTVLRVLQKHTPPAYLSKPILGSTLLAPALGEPALRFPSSTAVLFPYLILRP